MAHNQVSSLRSFSWWNGKTKIWVETFFQQRNSQRFLWEIEKSGTWREEFRVQSSEFRVILPEKVPKKIALRDLCGEGGREGEGRVSGSQRGRKRKREKEREGKRVSERACAHVRGRPLLEISGSIFASLAPWKQKHRPHVSVWLPRLVFPPFRPPRPPRRGFTTILTRIFFTPLTHHTGWIQETFRSLPFPNI